MVGSTDLQTTYNSLYTELRRYIWSFEAVNAIADLEISSYRAFADLGEVKQNLDRVALYARDIMKDDEDVKKAFDKFYDLLKDEDVTYVKLPAVREEI